MDIATLGLRIENNQVVQSTGLLDAMTAAGTRAESMAGRLKSAFGGLAAATGLTFLGAKFIKETIDAQNAMAQLEARVKSTGGAAGLTVQQLDDLSTSLQQVTTQSDEAVKGAEAMLLTFGKIKGDTFTRATADILDMAQAMGGDLQGAAIQVGKALQDPEQGLLALRRSGVSFSDAQQQVIKDLFSTGKEAEAQALILKELEKEFGGSAAAARDTLGGALQGLAHDFGDLFERTKAQTSATVDFINKIDSGIKSLRDYHTEVKTTVEVLGGAGLAATLAFLAPKVIAFASYWSFQVTAAFGAAAVAGTGLTGVLVGLGPAMTAASAGLGPIALLAAAGALAIYDLNKAFDDYNDKIAEANKNTPEYVAYLKALGHAHSQAGGAGQLVKPKPEPTMDDKATQQAMKDLDAQIRLQRALNDAQGASAATLDLIRAKQAALSDIEKFAVEHTKAQTTAYADKRNALLKLQEAEIYAKDAMERWLEISKKVEDGLATTTVRVAANANAWKDSAREYAAGTNAIMAQALPVIEAKSAQSIETSLRNSVRVALAAMQQYHDDLETIFRDGFNKIVTDGTKSFHDFFEDVFQMFSKLMERMRREGTQGDLAYRVLGYGSAAISAGVSGYQIGHSGGVTQGAFGGALSGAIAGSSFGPMGTVAGALIGAASGLLGAAKAQKEAAEAFKSQFQTNYLALLQQGVKAGTVSDRAYAVVEAHTAADQLYDAIDKNLAGLKNQAEREKELALVRQNETLIVAKLNEEERQKKALAEFEQFRTLQDLRLRNLNAQGLTAEAKAYQDELEVQDAVNQGRSAEYVALLKTTQALENANVAREKERQEAEQFLNDQRKNLSDALATQMKTIGDALRAQSMTAQDQARFAEQAHNDTARAVDNLRKLSGSLASGPLSALSPAQQLAAANAQVEQLFAAAQHGDKNAAATFGDAASTYLSKLRDAEGSGPGYAAGADRIQRMADVLLTQYGVQETIDQRMLDSANQQVELLQHQIDALQAEGDRLSKAIQDASVDQIASLSTQIANLGTTIAQSVQSAIGGLGGVVAGSIGGLGSTLGSAIGGIAAAVSSGQQQLLRSYDDFLKQAGAVGSVLDNPVSRNQWNASMGLPGVPVQLKPMSLGPAYNDLAVDDPEYVAAAARLESLRRAAAAGNYAAIQQLGGVSAVFQGYASGTNDTGLSPFIAGERGSELIVGGASRAVVSAGGTRDLLSEAMGASRETRAELREANRLLRQQIQALFADGAESRKLLARIEQRITAGNHEAVKARYAKEVSAA